MSDISNIKSYTLDKLTATVGSKTLAVTSITLRMQLEVPASCEVTLAQGETVKGIGSTLATSLKSTELDAFTPVVINLNINDQKEAIVLFRGIVSSVSTIAAKNVGGSYAGLVLNCIAPQVMVGAYSMNGYRYWGSAADSKGKINATLEPQFNELLNELGSGNLLTVFPNKESAVSTQEDFVNYVITATGILTEIFSDKRYTRDGIKIHYDTRGRKQLPGRILGNLNLSTDYAILKNIELAFSKLDPYSTIRAIFNKQLFMNLAPLPCGKMDIIPAFPWGSKPLAKIELKDILTLRDSTALSVRTANVDAVMVPVYVGPVEGDSLKNYRQYPSDKDMPAAGVAQIVNIPMWLSPFVHDIELYSDDAAYEPPTDELKINKAQKDTKENIEKKGADYVQAADALAQAFFAEVKNSGVTLEVGIPWYRLEFLDALGYLMEIEQPVIDARGESENLFGLLAGAAVKLQTTPGGSKASMVLSFTHVRDKTTHDKYAIDTHPLYAKEGGPEDALQAFFAKKDRIYSRSDQKTLEGGAHDDYLTQAINQASGKKK